jgi:hypothetical protein
VTISSVVERVLCPILVRRDDELAVLEDALLSAHPGESRSVIHWAHESTRELLDHLSCRLTSTERRRLTG